MHRVLRMARFRYWAFVILVECLALGLLSLGFSAEGIRILAPIAGRKVVTLPVVGAIIRLLGRVAGLGASVRRLDCAAALSLVFLAVSVYFLNGLLKFWLYDTPEDDRRNARVWAMLIHAFGSVLIGLEGVVFYRALVQTSWGGPAFSPSALLMTLLYLGVLLFVSLVSVGLGEVIAHIKREFPHVLASRLEPAELDRAGGNHRAVQRV